MSNENIKTHKNLEVWNKSMELAEKLYPLTASFPREEQFGLVAQIRRSVVSIPSNIAEGAARNSSKEFLHFLYIALGSLSELETQLLLAEKLNFLMDAAVLKDVEVTRKILLGLIRFVKGKTND